MNRGIDNILNLNLINTSPVEDRESVKLRTDRKSFHIGTHWHSSYFANIDGSMSNCGEGTIVPVITIKEKVQGCIVPPSAVLVHLASLLSVIRIYVEVDYTDCGGLNSCHWETSDITGILTYKVTVSVNKNQNETSLRILVGVFSVLEMIVQIRNLPSFYGGL